MRLLLDTHILLWTSGQSHRLSREAAELIAGSDNEIVFSIVSLWEAAIKNGLGRSDFSVDLRLLRRRLMENGYRELPVLGDHAIALEALPPIHKDPFDRILIAQARVEGLTLLTSDATVASYGELVRKV